MDTAPDRGTQAPVDVRGGIRLEGLHPLKHCLRFGGEVLRARTNNRASVLDLARDVCPDLVDQIDDLLEDVDDIDLVGDGRPPSVLPSPVVAVARRPDWSLADLAARPDRPVVVLERPTHFGNLGAVIRVAAAADAAGVVTTGPSDPWNPRAVRGSAGLHWALPVLRLRDAGAILSSFRPLDGNMNQASRNPTEGTRNIVALHPDGEVGLRLPPGSVLAFGSERTGLSDTLLTAADIRLALPMREGVSSLNLATSVAAVLYGPASS